MQLHKLAEVQRNKMNGVMEVFLPQRKSDKYFLETLTKRQIHTHLRERHQAQEHPPSAEPH